jgi:hypothetical protein
MNETNQGGPDPTALPLPGSARVRDRHDLLAALLDERLRLICAVNTCVEHGRSDLVPDLRVCIASIERAIDKAERRAA